MHLPTETDLTGLPHSHFTNQDTRREYNRHPLLDLFPRIPSPALENILDLCISKNFIYNLSESKRYNSLRYTSIVIAHVRHKYTHYDALLNSGGIERFDARKKSGETAWKVLKEWCPWQESNPVLERLFRNTLLRPEERDPEWDPMDVDIDEDDVTVYGDGNGNGKGQGGDGEYYGEPMDLD